MINNIYESKHTRIELVLRLSTCGKQKWQMFLFDAICSLDIACLFHKLCLMYFLKKTISCQHQNIEVFQKLKNCGFH